MRRALVKYGDGEEDLVPCARFMVEQSGALVLFADAKAVTGICAYAPGVWGTVEWEEMGS